MTSPASRPMLLSRMTMRRLDAESLRDTLLLIAGELDSSLFGPPGEMTVRDDGLIMASGRSGVGGGWRRSIYLRYRRTAIPTLMAAFDYPQMEPNCIKRTVSTVSPQALLLMNNRRIHDLAGWFAGRVGATVRGLLWHRGLLRHSGLLRHRGLPRCGRWPPTVMRC